MRVLLVAVILADLVFAGARVLRSPAVSAPLAPAPATTPATGDAAAAAPAVLAERKSPRHRVRRLRRAPRPVRVTIPAIGVDTRLVPIGLDATGALVPPATFTVAGWWRGGARPGERGPAIIAGHVDNQSGPAVFFRVPQLRRGDAIAVTRRDGSRVRFRVHAVGQFGKSHFPTAAVYGPTRRATLRLITCSGAFDYATGHYLDNTVIFAARS